MINYSPEIDGLRAIAVLLVVFFHAGIGPFKGGFIGVDIFFVISGYLIYSLLSKEYFLNKTINLQNFFLRRAKRLLPSIVLVVIVTFFINSLILQPSETYKLSIDSISALFFVSNFNFYKMDYFESGSKNESLLHTWSLGVEEQFYIFFPILLIFLLCFFRNKINIIFIVLSVISFFICIFYNKTHPNFTFYMLPARAWEFIFGIFAAEIIKKIDKRKENFKFLFRLNLDLLGLILVFIGGYFSSNSEGFPNFFLLIPVFGTFLIIVFSHKNSIVMNILSKKVFIFIGLISYSLYLWHWPVFVLSDFFLPNRYEVKFAVPLIFFSLIISTLTWKFVELPFRNQSKHNLFFSFKSIILLFCISSLILIHAFFSNGYYKRHFENLSTEELALYESNSKTTYEKIINVGCNYHSRTLTDEFKKRFNDCTKLSKAIIVFGDSHAIDIYNMIAISKKKKFVFGLSQGGCRHNNLNDDCHYNEAINFINKNIDKIQKIYINLAGNYMFKNLSGTPTNRNSFQIINHPEYNLNYEMIDAAVHLTNLINNREKIIFLGPVLEPHISKTKGFQLALNCDNLKVYPQKNTLKSFKKLDLKLKSIFEKLEINYISIINNFDYKWPEDFYSCKKLFWLDGDHTSVQGDRHFSDRILKILY